MNSFDEVQVEEDAAYYEWLWRQEMAIREELDFLGEVESVNAELAGAAFELCPF